VKEREEREREREQEIGFLKEKKKSLKKMKSFLKNILQLQVWSLKKDEEFFFKYKI
jgi:hypothetical protein